MGLSIYIGAFSAALDKVLVKLYLHLQNSWNPVLILCKVCMESALDRPFKMIFGSHLDDTRGTGVTGILYALRVTVAYSVTFPVAKGCHCNRLLLYVQERKQHMIV